LIFCKSLPAGDFSGADFQIIACRQAPTRGLDTHHAQSIEFRKSKFKDNHYLNFKYFQHRPWNLLAST
jgi:hypothetical protein